MSEPMPQNVTQNIFWTGVNDRSTQLFEALWPLPQGISYNAYLIRDEKTALIDAVKGEFTLELLNQLAPLIQGSQGIDYLVINHIEPDHSGAIEMLAARYPNMCIVGNEKTISLLKGFYSIPNPVKAVKDREILSLGNHSLEFILTPMAHWPETMVSFERSSGVLFSGDIFGGFGALPNGIFDDEINIPSLIPEIRRYFTNVIGKYSLPVQKALEKIRPLPLKIIASTHGPVYRTNPQRIIDLYGSLSRQETTPGAVIAFASMYGNTKKMALAVEQGLKDGGATDIALFDVSYTHPSFILSEMWIKKGLILGSCTHNGINFPLMDYLLDLAENSGLRRRTLGLFGAFSWSSSPLNKLKNFAEKTSCQLIAPCPEAKCTPTADALEACRLLGQNMAKELLA